MPQIAGLIKNDKIDKSCINIIQAGPDNGKTWYIANKLIKDNPEYSTEDILFVKSYLSVLHDDSIENCIPRESDLEKYLTDTNVKILSYHQLFDVIEGISIKNKDLVESARIIVFDEFQTLFIQTNVSMMYANSVDWLLKRKFKTRAEMFLAFTSAPQIIIGKQNLFNIKINWLNEDLLWNHKANRLVCTKVDFIPNLVKYDLHGKTVILCMSIDDCYKLHQQIPNSCIIAGMKGGSKKVPVTKEMGRFRRFIARNHKLPESCTGDGYEHPIDVLITTSIHSEGMGFTKSSGIRNIVSCVGSDIFISELAERLSYDYDCLAIANPPRNNIIFKNEPYINRTNMEFGLHLVGKHHNEWVESVLPYVNCKEDDIEYFLQSKDTIRFSEYLHNTWVVPDQCEESYQYKIWRKQDKAEIIAEFKKCKMNCEKKKATFNGVMHEIIRGSYGIDVVSHRQTMDDGKCHTYKMLRRKDPQAGGYGVYGEVLEAMKINPDTNEWEYCV